MPRKIIVYIATGYTARQDGDVGWLDRPQPPGNYGAGAFFRSIDTILWGRKTYDFALRMGGMKGYGRGIRHYVFSHRLPAKGRRAWNSLRNRSAHSRHGCAPRRASTPG